METPPPSIPAGIHNEPTTISSLPKVTVNAVAFNHDASSFTVATNLGFRVYNTEPLKYRFGTDVLGPIRLAKALFRTNIVAFVGASAKDYPPSRVIIWDHLTTQMTGMIQCDVDVNSVEICRDRIVVITRSQVYIHDMNTLEALAVVSTVPNMNALGQVSACNGVIAYLSDQLGRVKIYREAKDLEIECHNSNIYQMALNMEGTLLATASDKGTLIRIFDTTTGKNLQVVRRGADKALISNLRFSQDSRFLCASSNKGTIHLYALRKADQSTDTKLELASSSGTSVTNRRSYLAQCAQALYIPLPAYFNSEWSFAKIYPTKEGQTDICAFYQNKDKDRTNWVIVLTKEGHYYKYQFVPGQEEVKTIQSSNWLI